uniref:Uncharacterized protein n=1 Tax=Schistosoma curassoni TaxID=6186 RepID=A0A183JQH8_9TREM
MASCESGRGDLDKRGDGLRDDRRDDNEGEEGGRRNGLIDGVGKRAQGFERCMLIVTGSGLVDGRGERVTHEFRLLTGSGNKWRAEWTGW